MVNLTEIIIIWLSFQVVKSVNNALRHDYKHWKQRFGVPDKWDFWFNPAISHNNKYRGKIFWFVTWKMITPFSDFWHTAWTVFQIGWTVIMVINFGWYGLFIAIGGVFIVFNSIYNWLRYKKFI